jgi:hypothetical protein
MVDLPSQRRLPSASRLDISMFERQKCLSDIPPTKKVLCVIHTPHRFHRGNDPLFALRFGLVPLGLTQATREITRTVLSQSGWLP